MLWAHKRFDIGRPHLESYASYGIDEMYKSGLEDIDDRPTIGSLWIHREVNCTLQCIFHSTFLFCALSRFTGTNHIFHVFAAEVGERNDTSRVHIVRGGLRSAYARPGSMDPVHASRCRRAGTARSCRALHARRRALEDHLSPRAGRARLAVSHAKGT